MLIRVLPRNVSNECLRIQRTGIFLKLIVVLALPTIKNLIGCAAFKLTSRARILPISTGLPVYNEQKYTAVIPLRPLKSNIDHLALLEENHHLVLNEGVKFIAVRPTNDYETASQNGEVSSKFLQHSLSQSSSLAIKGNPRTTNSTRQAIIPIAELRHSHFVGPVGIGTPPQVFHLIFDTGSTNLQVVGTGCKCSSCRKVHRFDPKLSKTFQLDGHPVHLDITFGTGSIHSLLSEDTVTLGPFVVQRQGLGVIDFEAGGLSRRKNTSQDIRTSNIFDQIHFEGIVGFGFPSLSSAGVTPFFDKIMDTGSVNSNEFAIYMGTPESNQTHRSAFFIGGVDPRFYHGPIKMIPVVQEHYWEVKLNAFYVGNKKFCCEEEIDEFMNLVPSKKCNFEDPNFLDQFPTLVYKLDAGVDVVLTPAMYIIQSKNGECKPAFMQIDVPSKFGHAYILGAVAYMRHYFTVFQRGRNGAPSKIGIAAAKHTAEGASFLESLSSSSSHEI